MDGRKSLGILGLSGGVLVLGIMAACSAPAPDEASRGASSAATERPFDRNNVLDDKSMRDSTAMTAADVQKFLNKTPWGTKSVLAGYTENGKTAAQIMAEQAKTHGINPLEMLVRVQMEQSLVYKTTAPASTIALAFGCGCPHSPVCSDKYRGFEAQADCAAGTLRRSMDKALTTSGTVSGWARNKSSITDDKITIIPKNAVTAALYTYTPWVGEHGGGKAGVGGVSLHAQVWNRFAEAASYGEWAVTGNTTEADAGPAAPVDPPIDPPIEEEPEPTPDAGAPNTDSGTAPRTDAGADSGTKVDPPASESGTKGAPENGSEDDEILGEGSQPPSQDVPPPRGKKSTPSKPEELPSASDDELAAKSKASEAGCNAGGATGSSGAAGSAWLVGLALVLVASRRRSL